MIRLSVVRRTIALAAASLTLTLFVQAVSIDSHLDLGNSVDDQYDKKGDDFVSNSVTNTENGGVTGTVSISASTAVTATKYEFTAKGETSVSNGYGSAKALAGCKTYDHHPAERYRDWPAVSSDVRVLDSIPFIETEYKKFVFTHPVNFTASYSVAGSGKIPSFKATIVRGKQNPSANFSWERGNGTKSTDKFKLIDEYPYTAGGDSLVFSTAGESYAESCHGTVGPGTYYVAAAAVWAAYGGLEEKPCKGEMSFRVNFTPDKPLGGQVELISGTVNVIRDGVTQPLGKGDTVYVGDVVKSDSKSFVKLQLADGTLINLSPESSVKVEFMQKKSPGVLNLLYGRLKAELKEYIKNQPGVQIINRNGGSGVRMALGGARFELSYSELNGIGTSKLAVTEGVVELIDYRRGTVTKVPAGQSGSVVGPVEKDIPPLAPEIAVYDSKANDLAAGLSEGNWGKVPTDGDGVEKSFRIRNIWTTDLSGIKVRIIGKHAEDFALTAPTADLLPGGAATNFSVTFKPSASGPRSATLRITSNDADESTFDIDLVGNAKPEIAVTLPSGDNLTDGVSEGSFGSVNVGESSNIRTCIVKNVGVAQLSNLSARLRGQEPKDFRILNTLPNVLRHGETALLKVKFKPTAKGTRTAKLKILSNDANENPFDIGLKGKGVE